MALYKITRTKVHKAYYIFTYFSYTFKENVSGYKCHRKCSETFNSEKKQMTVALLLKKGKNKNVRPGSLSHQNVF